MKKYLVITLHDEKYKNHLEYLGYYLKKVLQDFVDIDKDTLEKLSLSFLMNHDKILHKEYLKQYFSDNIVQYLDKDDTNEIFSNLEVIEEDNINNLICNNDTLIDNLTSRVRGYYWIQ